MNSVGNRYIFARESSYLSSGHFSFISNWKKVIGGWIIDCNCKTIILDISYISFYEGNRILKKSDFVLYFCIIHFFFFKISLSSLMRNSPFTTLSSSHGYSNKTICDILFSLSLSLSLSHTYIISLRARVLHSHCINQVQRALLLYIEN